LDIRFVVCLKHFIDPLYFNLRPCFTIVREGLQNFGVWSACAGEFLSCHTCCDTAPRVLSLSCHTCLWHGTSGFVFIVLHLFVTRHLSFSSLSCQTCCDTTLRFLCLPCHTCCDTAQRFFKILIVPHLLRHSTTVFF
jgi:hypothetical protein